MVFFNSYQIITPSTKKIYNKDFYIVQDHMPSHALGELNLKTALLGQNTINNLFLTNNVDISSKFFIIEDYLFDDIDSDYKINLNYFFLMEFKNLYQRIIYNHKNFNYQQKTINFNCVLNKFREHRGILSCWLKTKQFDNFIYTQGWDDHCESYINLVDELLFQTDSRFADTINFLDKKWIGPEHPSTYTQNIPLKNAGVFDLRLKELFNQSIVAVITGPHFYELGFSIDEKYINSIIGRNIPFFLNYNFSEVLTQLGFDIFDDIININYQSYKNPVLRTLIGLDSNFDILKSAREKIEYTDDIKHRLENNFENLLNFEKLIENSIYKLNQKNNIELFKKIYSVNPDLSQRYSLFDNFL